MGSWNLDVVGAAFARAAVDPSQWDRAMEVVASETGSLGTALFPIRGRSPRIPFTRSLGEAFERYLSEGWVHRDERYRAVPWIERHGVATDLDFISEEEMGRHAYYEEFLAPFKLRWFAAVRVAAEDDLLSLAIQRTAAEGPFSPREQKKLAALSPRLCSAAAVARAFGFARAEAALEAFSASGSAILLLDIRGDVVRANVAAERLLDSEIKIVRRRIVSVDRDATAALDRALHALLWTRAESALMPPVRLPRTSNRPLLAYPMRLDGVSASIFAPCQAIVVLVDTASSRRPPESALSAIFGLSAAEARLAANLATGASLTEVADGLAVAKETARTQLKAVFEKTGARRQGEFGCAAGAVDAGVKKPD